MRGPRRVFARVQDFDNRRQFRARIGRPPETLKRFGTECNLGNIAPADVLSLETLRLGLRSDTVERFALGETRSADSD